MIRNIEPLSQSPGIQLEGEIGALHQNWVASDHTFPLRTAIRCYLARLKLDLQKRLQHFPGDLSDRRQSALQKRSANDIHSTLCALYAVIYILYMLLFTVQTVHTVQTALCTLNTIHKLYKLYTQYTMCKLYAY